MPTAVNRSGNPDIDALLWGYKWDFTNLGVRFPQLFQEFQGYAAAPDFQPFNSTQANQIFLALSNLSAFCGLTFYLDQNFGGGNLRFAQASRVDYNDGHGPHVPGFTNASAEGNPPDPAFPVYAQGDTWYNIGKYTAPELGSFQYAAGLLHEVGHALGLKHGHATQSSHGVDFPSLPAAHDSQEYSIMTYRVYAGSPDPNTYYPTGTVEYPWTYMQNDVAALQYLYGANYGPGANNTNTTYKFNPTTGELTINGTGFGPSRNASIFLTIWDGGGVDTYDFSNYSANQTVNLNPGDWSTFSPDQAALLGDGKVARGNVANALLFNNDPRSLIENAVTGSGADSVTGNQAVNFLNGGAGADSLRGMAGNDFLLGGLGGDALDGGAGSDTATYSQATAGVTANLQLGVGAGGEAQGDSYVSIEIVVGSNFNDVLVGKAGVADTLNGGVGADTFYGEGIDVFMGGAGLDTIFAAAGAALNLNVAAAGVETVWGGFLADTLNGTTAMTALTLVGQGPTGDTMRGGGGADFIYFRNGDTVAGGAGADWAVATLSSTGVNLNLVATGFENAWGSTSGDTLTAAGGTGAVVLVGDAGADTLTGGGGGDFLYGMGDGDILNGGAGNDNLVGGLGVDSFRFGAGWGRDIVWDWANGSEKFNLAGSGATSYGQLTVTQNFSGSGNALIAFGANQILVVAGANKIDAGDFLFA